VLDLTTCPMLGWSLDSAFEGSHWERTRWKNLERILCIFYFLFLYVIWKFTMPRFNISSSFLRKKYLIVYRSITAQLEPGPTRATDPSRLVSPWHHRPLAAARVAHQRLPAAVEVESVAPNEDFRESNRRWWRW
jgi:hypothetical protein